MPGRDLAAAHKAWVTIRKKMAVKNGMVALPSPVLKPLAEYADHELIAELKRRIKKG